jgi:urease gamma subunit
LRRVERGVSETYQVAGIKKLVMQRVKHDGVWEHNLMYEVKWKGYEETTLEPVEELVENVAVESFWQKMRSSREEYLVEFIDYSNLLLI